IALPYPPLAFEGRGTARSAVEGLLWASSPSTMLRMVPLPCKCRGGFLVQRHPSPPRLHRTALLLGIDALGLGGAARPGALALHRLDMGTIDQIRQPR